MPKSNENTTITLVISPELKEKFRLASKEAGLSLSSWMRSRLTEDADAEYRRRARGKK
jgi:predicted HicB family RNase H-like nuclease